MGSVQVYFQLRPFVRVEENIASTRYSIAMFHFITLSILKSIVSIFLGIYLIGGGSCLILFLLYFLGESCQLFYFYIFMGILFCCWGTQKILVYASKFQSSSKHFLLSYRNRCYFLALK